MLKLLACEQTPTQTSSECKAHPLSSLPTRVRSDLQVRTSSSDPRTLRCRWCSLAACGARTAPSRPRWLFELKTVPEAQCGCDRQRRPDAPCAARLAKRRRCSCRAHRLQTPAGRWLPRAQFCRALPLKRWEGAQSTGDIHNAGACDAGRHIACARCGCCGWCSPDGLHAGDHRCMQIDLAANGLTETALVPPVLQQC